MSERSELEIFLSNMYVNVYRSDGPWGGCCPAPPRYAHAHTLSELIGFIHHSFNQYFRIQFADHAEEINAAVIFTVKRDPFPMYSDVITILITM